MNLSGELLRAILSMSASFATSFLTENGPPPAAPGEEVEAVDAIRLTCLVLTAFEFGGKQLAANKEIEHTTGTDADIPELLEIFLEFKRASRGGGPCPCPGCTAARRKNRN